VSDVLILDASAAVRLAMGELGCKSAVAEAAEVVAPTLFVTEVANTLWKYVRAGQLDLEVAVEKLRGAVALCDRLEPMNENAAIAALRGAVGAAHPVYDLVYLNLAQAEDASLATADNRLAELATTLGVTIVRA
jgi:predicted nucleic acid-binding protein